MVMMKGVAQNASSVIDAINWSDVNDYHQHIMGAKYMMPGLDPNMNSCTLTDRAATSDKLSEEHTGNADIGKC